MINSLTSIGNPIALTSNAPSHSSAAEKVAKIGQEFASVLQQGEQAAIAGMTGELSLHEAISKVLDAERAFHTAIAVRDKTVGAYLEISRMQI